MTTGSIWRRDVGAPECEKHLTGGHTVDVVVVGSGITGLTTAYQLVCAGKRVMVLEKDTLASGESMRTTAFLNYFTDSDLSDLVKKFGKEKAGTVWRSLRTAIATIERIIGAEKIDCEFVSCPLVYYASNDKDRAHIEKEYNLMRELEFPVVLQTATHGLFRHAIEISDNAKFHPLKYLYGLARAIQKRGGVIYEQSGVTEYNLSELYLKTADATVHADQVVIATHNPNNWAFDVHSRIKPYQTYVIAGTCAPNAAVEGMYIDSADPYHYFRVDRLNGQNRFLLGGEDHETGKKIDDGQYARLESYLQQLMPHGGYEITHRWSGQVIGTVDGLPFIGREILHSENLLTASGYGGDGMTFGTLAGMILADSVCGERNEYADLYSTKRFKGVAELVKTNIAFVKEFIKGRGETHGRVAISELGMDTGAVVSEGGKQIAVYKDSSGNVTKLSAVCTHRGCVVAWNGDEKTWDCPCHGSRYEKDGRVKRGPAMKPLAKL